jgi:hypothetical protein
VPLIIVGIRGVFQRRTIQKNRIFDPLLSPRTGTFHLIHRGPGEMYRLSLNHLSDPFAFGRHVPIKRYRCLLTNKTIEAFSVLFSLFQARMVSGRVGVFMAKSVSRIG